MNVLIAAPTGYVGRELLLRFEREGGMRLRVLTPDARRIPLTLRPSTEVVEADPFDPTTLERSLREIDVAYYPIRIASLERGFEARLAEFARMFRDACIRAGVKRIVVIGAPTVDGDTSPIQSILPESGEVLGACPDRIQTVRLLPDVIIGPGSIAYEMVMSPVGKLPILFLPRWTRAVVRPIALSDVVEYLVLAAALQAEGNALIEIGGEPIRLDDLFRLAARVRGVSRVMIPVPLTAPRLSAFLLMLATPFSYPLSLTIVRFLDAVRSGPPSFRSGDAERCFPRVTPLSCEEAVRKALAATDSDEVESRWTDSLAGISYRSSETDLDRARYRAVRRRDFGGIPPSDVFRSVVSLGGEEGWFTFDMLWRVRGLMDKLLGGFGTSLGRRSASTLRVGDMLDVWRVVDLVENERLLLKAQMKVFGEAWLEFRIRGTTLVQTAYYHPDGAPGRLYWLAMLPFHAFIFPDMARNIVRRAALMRRRDGPQEGAGPAGADRDPEGGSP